MSFVSKLKSGILIVDDTTDVDSITPDGVHRGYIPRDYDKVPVGAVASPFPYPTLSREVIIDMIKEREHRGQMITEIADNRGVVRLNQQQTNYCWFNAVVSAIHNQRAASGMDFVPLSPASGAAPIRGFRNEGGFGGEALQWLRTNGCNTQQEWPANAIDSRYYTQKNKDLAKRNMILEAYELDPHDILQLFTALVMGFSCPVALMWWGHEVCTVDPKVVGRNTLAAETDNSWGASYGTNGRLVLEESKLSAADQLAVRSVTLY